MAMAEERQNDKDADVKVNLIESNVENMTVAGTLINNIYSSGVTELEPAKAQQILEELRGTLQSHIRTNLSTIRIPASSLLLDLSEAVLNQSLRRTFDQNDPIDAKFFEAEQKIKEDDEAKEKVKERTDKETYGATAMPSMAPPEHGPTRYQAFGQASHGDPNDTNKAKFPTERDNIEAKQETKEDIEEGAYGAASKPSMAPDPESGTSYHVSSVGSLGSDTNSKQVANTSEAWRQSFGHDFGSESDSEGSEPPIESDLDDESISSESHEFAHIQYAKMLEVIETAIKLGRRLILIVAAGGRGKTTAANKFMHEWGKGIYLPDCYVVLRLDMKQVEYDKSLYDNVRKQYQVIEGTYSPVELNQIEEAFRFHQEHLVWMLDGIDESPSHADAERFIFSSQQRFSKSIFVMLTREEGRPIIGPIILQALEFRMNDLDSDQCDTFITKFPFSGKKAEEKRQLLLDTWKENAAVRAAFPIPINAAMICRLYDDETFSRNVQNESDIIEALYALVLKSAELKDLDIPSATEDQKKRRNKLLKASLKDVMTKKRELLSKLGYAIFICNGSSLVGFENLDEEKLRANLTLAGMSANDQNYMLRLDVLDQKKEDQKSIFLFYHRNIREYTVALFASYSPIPIPLDLDVRKLTENHLSVYRCILAQLQGSGRSGKMERVVEVTSHFLHSYQGLSEWTISQLLCEIVQFGRNKRQKLRKALREVVKIIQILKIPFNDDVMRVLKSSYLQTHLKGGKIVCTSCKTPEKAKKREDLVKGKDQQKSNLNWPENKHFTLSPFLVKGDDFVQFCIPHGRLAFRKHISSDAIIKRFKRPKMIGGM